MVSCRHISTLKSGCVLTVEIVAGLMIMTAAVGMLVVILKDMEDMMRKSVLNDFEKMKIIAAVSQITKEHPRAQLGTVEFKDEEILITYTPEGGRMAVAAFERPEDLFTCAVNDRKYTFKELGL